MARTVLRQFTGGLSNEIDPQNLRDDQGEESLDINLKGFALEPGEGTAPISGGHYYYRGEWITDSKAVSFEESGIGVVKTYNDERPQFEEIIKDDVNISRSLGPPLPPAAVISGTVVSEGTRGERPAEGSHLLKISETVLGVVDKAPDADSSAQSLETYKADSTTVIDDIYYYGSQAYWIEKSGTNFTVVTRAYNSTTGEFTSSNISSPACPHNSGGHFFKGGYFVCWDNQFIDSVQLDNVSMSGSKFDTIETTNHSDGGDAGSEGFGTNAGGDFESGASSTEITGVDIDGSGIISFSQRITTANTVPSEYTDSDKERWLRMPSGSGGCFVVLLRDGMPKSDSESNGTGNYTETDDDIEVWTDQNENVFKEWIVPTGKLTTDLSKNSNPGTGNRWSSPKIGEELEALGDVPYGFKYAVVFAKNDTWVRIKYVGVKYPEIMVLPKALGSGQDASTSIAEVHATRNLRSYWRKWERDFEFVYNNVIYYQDYIDIELVFPSINSYNNKIKWSYTAPTGDTGGSFQNKREYSSYALNEFPSHDESGKYGWTHWNARTWYWDISGSWITNNGTHAYGGQAGSWTRNLYSFNSKTKAISQLGTNNIASPNVPGKMHRLCSYVRDGDVTQQGGFSVSKLWTKARITKENTIEFAEAKHKNFRVGDSIRIGQNGTNQSLHLNLRGSVRKEKDDRWSAITEQQKHLTAKILEINEGVSLKISPPNPDSLGTGKYLDEDCYPVISSFIDSPYNFDASDAPGPVCSVIQSDLSSHVLVGHDATRGSYDGDTRTGEIIEVRLSGAPKIETGSEVNYTHRGIPWIGQDVRAVDAVVGSAPRIFYTKGTKVRKLFSQKGSGADVSAESVLLSLNGGYYVDKDYLTHFDDKGITIFTPDLLTKPYVKANPTLSDGLGLTGNITDARTFVDSSNAVYVCAKIGGYWKLVKTSSTGPESSLLSYDFKKPIGFDNTKIWGIDSDSKDGWDIQYATPFYESDIIGSWVFFANSYETLTPTTSAWGQVVDFRIGETGNNGIPRYLSIDWKMDSGNWFGTGTPTIGLNDEADNMIAENTFKWYPIPTSFPLTTSGTGTVIADLSYLDPPITNTHTPLAPVEIPFKSKVYRDIVFFKASETLLPTAGDTGGESKITFLGYQDVGQSFYVLSDNLFKVVPQFGREPEDAYRLGQADIAGTAFDASKIGISSFLIGAPNMYNGYGPNIDFYYRASFVNKWGHESAPSPLPSKGITALDSADDCIQVNFNAPFFRFTDTDIDTIRLYRYGGDSSEFMFLSDIPMPVLPFTTTVVDGETIKTRYFPTISGINSVTNGFSRKSAVSPYYLLKTNNDISSLSGFTNSNFLLNATPSSLDGSWRVNQVSENSSPGVAYTSVLTEDLNTTATTVKLNYAITKTWESVSGATWIYYKSVAHGLTHGDKIRVSTTGTFPTPNQSSTPIAEDTDYWISLTGGSNPDPDDYFQIHFNENLSGNPSLLDGYGTGVHSFHVSIESVWPESGVIKLGTEYISYTGASSNDLTGCVRGINDTNASDHLPGQIQSITVTAAGTGYGTHNDAAFVSGDIGVTSFTDDGAGNLLVNCEVRSGTDGWGGGAYPYGGGLAPDTEIVFFKPPSGSTLPEGITAETTYYVNDFGQDTRFLLATSSGGANIAISNNSLGTGTGNSFSATFIKATGGTPTNEAFLATYEVNGSTGAITGTSVINPGQGYLSTPSAFTISDPYNSYYGTTAATGATIGHTFNAGVTANVVEWELEMEHRNQDTTTLTEALPVLTGTANVINVTDTSVFPAPSTKTFTASSDAGLLITSNAHGLEDNDLITVSSTDTLPTGLSISTNYYVKFEDANTFRLALSSGGTAIAYTDAGLGTHSMLILPKLLIGSEILAYTGKTAYTFTGVTPAIKGTIASTHGLNVLVRSYDEVFATTTVTNASIEIEGFGFRDKARTPISSLYEMQTDNWPPLGLEYNESLKQFFETESEDDYFRYIKAVGSMYFGALDANLRFSKYGTPEYWPLSAVITLDSEIRCIEEHAGEGLVFTTNSVYRVRGTDPKAMIAFRVPDARGLPAGYEHTVSDFNGGLIWLTASDGICMYSAGRATYLTRDKHDIGRLKAPYSCVVDGVYWLFQEPGSGTGYRLELSTGEMRLAQTTIEAYYAYFAKALGVGVVVTKDNTINPDRDSEFLVEEIGGAKASNIEWRSKKIDAGEPAIPKALGSIAIVYEALNSSSAETIVGGIRGQALTAELLGLDPDDLNAGDIAAAESTTTSDLYSIFTKYDEPNQTFVVDTDGVNLTNTERRTIVMPMEFITSTVTVGDRVWNELLADNTVVESVGTEFVGNTVEDVVASDGSSDLLFTDAGHTLVDGDEIQFTAVTTLPGNITVDTNYYVNAAATNTFKVETVVDGGNVQYSTTVGSGVKYGKTNPVIVLDKEPLRTGEGTIYWGNLPMVEVYLNNDAIPSRVFTLPPGDVVEPQSMDLYLRDLRRFRTISVAIQGDVRVQALSLRHYPLQTYQSSTLHHSADVFYKGDVDFRVMLDGNLIYRKQLSNAGDDFKEERIYLPASSFGQRAHYMNESRAGMIESVNFNGSIAA